jgi:ABC-type transport system involved in cytochrome bd biosynthesis fused ATPase/permease subunit
VTYDSPPEAYDKEALHRQVGFVFQDSILFNLTLRENIAFSTAIPLEDMEKAVATAELQDFVATLPLGLTRWFQSAEPVSPEDRNNAYAGPSAGAQSQSAAAR